MSTRTAGYSGFDWGTFSVDATTALTLNSTAATGHNLDAAEGTTSVHVSRALVSCPTANLRYTTSGATPTSATWHKLLAGDVLEIDVDPRKFKFIAEVAGPSTVYADYHANG